LRKQTQTADASTALSEPRSPATAIDAPVASNPAADAGAIVAIDAANEEIKAEATEAAPKSVEAAASDDKAGETKSADKPAEFDASGKVDAKAASIEMQNPAQPADESATAQLPATDPVSVENAAPEAAKVAKDQARPSDPEKPAKPDSAVAAAPSRGRIAVFVSRKDGKLYVRQNFAPLFEVPIAIAPGDRPLGTHVFTAQTEKDDANLLHWSVVSMPVGARDVARPDDDERASRRRKTTGAIEVKPAPVPDSAAEALDRLTIPADTMARIAEALSTGGSIIVSDQGINAGETGEGTDFIVPLR
jgi:hypothetical protein